MAKNLDTYNKAEKVSGWYYDLQLDNRFFCASLHANTVYKPANSENGSRAEWVPWNSLSVPDGDPSRGGLSSKVDTAGPGVTRVDSDDENYQYYSLEPICKAIINEDFSAAASNVWTDYGGDAIGEWFSGFKYVAPYADKAESALNIIREKSKALAKSDSSFVGKLAGGLNKLVSGASDLMKNSGIVDYLNSTLVTQGNRFKYYSGTGTAFGNLAMRFTLFPIWRNQRLITVMDQLDFLYPYFVGKYEPLDTERLASYRDKNGQVQTNAKLKSALDDMKVADFVAWQRPPGGFRAKVRDVDIVQKGTLKLRFGPQYYIDNLLCSDVSLNFSKQMMKYPDPTGNGLDLTPLYCDVNLTLTPATKYSDIKLKEFTTGDIGAVEDMSNKVNTRVDSIRGKLKETYGGGSNV